MGWFSEISHSTKGMHHVNIRENCVREVIHKFFDIMVSHIGGIMNPADLFMKEHKLDEIFALFRT